MKWTVLQILFWTADCLNNTVHLRQAEFCLQDKYKTYYVFPQNIN